MRLPAPWRALTSCLYVCVCVCVCVCVHGQVYAHSCSDTLCPYAEPATKATPCPRAVLAAARTRESSLTPHLRAVGAGAAELKAGSRPLRVLRLAGPAREPQATAPPRALLDGERVCAARGRGSSQRVRACRARQGRQAERRTFRQPKRTDAPRAPSPPAPSSIASQAHTTSRMPKPHGEQDAEHREPCPCPYGEQDVSMLILDSSRMTHPG